MAVNVLFMIKIVCFAALTYISSDFCYNDVSDKNDSIHNTGEIIKKYVMTNINFSNVRILDEYLTIYIVDIDSKSEISYNNNKEFEIIRRFIGSDTLEEMKSIINESNGLLSQKLLEEMINFMNNKEVQDYSRQEKLIRSNIKTAKDEGRNERELEITKNMLNKKISLDIISDCTGLSLEELKKLQEETK